MAYDYRRQEEHAFQILEEDIKRGNVPRLVLLCGKEEYLIDWYAKQLADTFVSEVSRPLDLIVLEGDQVSAARVRESLETVSLMSERKVVWLPEFHPAAGRTMKGCSESEVQELVDYFNRIPEGSMLLLTVAHKEEIQSSRKDLEKITKNRVRSAVEKYGKVYDFEPLKRRRQLQRFIEKRLRTAGKSYMPSLVDLIISESGYGVKGVDYSLYELDNDLRKMIAHSGDAPDVRPSDVRGIITTNPENNVFAMLDAIGRNRKDEAFRLLHNLLTAGVGEMSLLWRITDQLELILSVKEMREAGKSTSVMQKQLGVHEFKIKKAMEVTGNFSIEDLRRILRAAYEVDEQIKTGLFDRVLALEYFIAKI